MIYDGGWLLSLISAFLALDYLALSLGRLDPRRFLQIILMELILMERDRPGDSFGNCARGAQSPGLARSSGYGLNRPETRSHLNFESRPILSLTWFYCRGPADRGLKKCSGMLNVQPYMVPVKR